MKAQLGTAVLPPKIWLTLCAHLVGLMIYLITPRAS